jgi:hypothetical protein
MLDRRQSHARPPQLRFLDKAQFLKHLEIMFRRDPPNTYSSPNARHVEKAGSTPGDREQHALLEFIQLLGRVKATSV